MQPEQTYNALTRIPQRDIAVIGMACRFPQAATYEEYWENLKRGRSCIEEVPASRWNWEAYWGDPLTEKNRTNSKWGGFLSGVDSFDPDFFGISVKEVERMDPQQRIMLEMTWSCFEDAGIKPSAWSGKRVGVFLGVFNFDYKELQEKQSGLLSIEAHHSTGTASALIANRISYYFNFKGPSLPIDTACSSSLSAIHAAIQSLHQGESSIAVAGGINLLLTPTRHISFSKTGMLSATGSCKTFDDAADGYVRGEGAGMLLLKPLEQALADGDPICGIIKGSAVNHGGKTYSLTYPNADAQRDVIMDAWKMAGVSADTIGYVEAHGTGTPKGDPIEFQALTNAFQEGTADNEDNKQYCGLGSVKTNVGHLEAAAGVAGVIKVLLSMRHRQLPGLQNFKRLNHRISLENTPFYLVTQLQAWKPLRINDNELPLRAGISSFGFGGTNAHVIVEEAPAVNISGDKDAPAPPLYMVCIAAKTGEALMQKEKDLLGWLNRPDIEVSVADVCKTLALGREHFPKRTVVIVEDLQQLKEKLAAADKQADHEGYFSNGRSLTKKEPEQQLFAGVGAMVVEALTSGLIINKEDYYQKLVVLAELYLRGYEPDWDKPFFGSDGRRLGGLPAYPFAKGSYWIPELNAFSTEGGTTKTANANAPLLSGQNISGAGTQKFSFTFNGNEFFLKDHVINGQRVLPAVAFLEMIRDVVMQSTKGSIKNGDCVCLQNIIWAQPVIIGHGPVELHISLFHEEGGNMAFKVYSESYGPEKTTVVFCNGIAAWQEQTATSFINAEAGATITGEPVVLSKASCYAALTQMGFNYGPAHQALESVYTSGNEHIANLLLPAATAGTLTDYFLHPALLDGALQAALVVAVHDIKKNGGPGLYVPFSVEHIRIIRPCTADMRAVIHINNDKELSRIKYADIDLFDTEGNGCVSMKGIAFKEILSNSLPGISVRNIRIEKEGVLLLTREWKETPVAAGAGLSPYINRMLFLCDSGPVTENYLKERLPEVGRFVLLQGAQENIGQRFQGYARKLFEEVQALLKEKPAGKILVQVIVFESEEKSLFSGLCGLLRTAHLENPNFIGQLLYVASPEGIQHAAEECACFEKDQEIKYINGKRYLPAWQEIMQDDDKDALPWKDNGVYLITGGAGGLGLIIAREIADKVKAPCLILTGRSSLNETIKRHIDELTATGAQVEYRQCDVSDKRAVQALIQNIQRDHHQVNGIIHSAGIVQDNFIIKKSKEEVMAVLAPKVPGVTYLDQATCDWPLDFFILFSSIVAPLGNPGQADYAAANGYLDAYATYRNQLVRSQKRQGHTVSINWPLWKEGGMQLEKNMEKALLGHVNMELLDTPTGISSLYRAMQAGVSQVLVACGQRPVLEQMFFNPGKKQETRAADSVPPLAIDNGIEKKAVVYLKELLSVTIKRPVDQIEADAPLEKYGIDSIMVMQMTNQLERVFGSLPKTLFFEYQNIQELTGYFLQHHSHKLTGLLDKDEIMKEENNGQANGQAYQKNGLSAKESVVPAPTTNLPAEQTGEGTALDIAIIGLAGRYPQADNIREFWKNLVNGKDCITEIPAERWDYRLYFDADKTKEGKSYSKWGGFLNDVDKFDPLFFNISPSEAERMDPQERLFLQCVYETIEDAGYTRHSLNGQKYFGLGNHVGVYVGVMYEEYQMFGAQEALSGRPVALWGLPSSIANRVSYFCDFHGPSMAVDTMCSSSLTAIHLACESIVRGKCEVAIAGGVNVSVHPNKYLFLSQGRFASSKGRCESFGIGGDGYVPGEGVGAVLLKPLQKAIADGDNIYGVIKSTAINHGGKTNGYTVPNLKAQASVIARALKEAGVDPGALSYIEAHGTGTSLGDPIEIAGLSKAFYEHTTNTGFCAIGSAKSNIGHCESAAGIAGLTKVLLQLKYRQIVPSLHSQTLNANIDFSKSPFTVQQELSEWKRPVLEKDGQLREYPLCAGISSFGAGGANAHLIIEEYISQSPQPFSENGGPKEEPVLVVLSAMDEERLKAQARQLLTALNREHRDFWDISTHRLKDLAYTLQVGREPLEHRLALHVSSVDDLRWKLERFLNGSDDAGGIFCGHTTVQAPEAGFVTEEAMQQRIREWMSKKKYELLADAWVKGAKVDWNQLYRENRRSFRRVSLPTYPFKKERYWVGEVVAGIKAFQGNKNEISYIHPLLHENISDITAHRYRVTFSGDEFYLRDHKVNGQKILPAAAHLEMIRAAIVQSAKIIDVTATDIQLRNIHWLQPVIVQSEKVHVSIELFFAENADVGYEIYTNDEEKEERIIFSHGTAIIEAPAPVDNIGNQGIQAIQTACSRREVAKSTCYKAFEAIGFQYGPTHQAIERAFVGNDKLLAKILLTLAFDSKADFFLHPALMDAALQASLLWNWTDEDSPLTMYLPYAIDAVEIYSDLSAAAWVVISKSATAGTGIERLLDIDILNADGALAVRLKGVHFKTPPAGWLAGISKDSNETLLLAPEWKKSDLQPVGVGEAVDRHLVLLYGFENNAHELASQLPHAEIITLEAVRTVDFNALSFQVFDRVRSLLQTKGIGKMLMQVLVHDDGGVGFTGIAGLLRTAQIENPAFRGQVISIADRENVHDLIEKIKNNASFASEHEIRYQPHVREVWQWSIPELSEPAKGYPWKDKAIYLITGGLGGLGYIFAREIAQKAKAVTLVLTGRSAPDNERAAKITALQQLGARVVYKQLDVTDGAAVHQLIQFIENELGGLQGIIHSAGVTIDNFLINKTDAEWKQVLSPKVSGIQHLDEAGKNSPLDFFILFSSIAGALGNAGQADYATANAFMDKYAYYRNALVANGQRTGHTLSINWSLWEQGGMQVDEETKNYLFHTMGMVPLPTNAGLEAFYQALHSRQSQVMIIQGDRSRITEKIIAPPQKMQPAATPAAVALLLNGNGIMEEAIDYFKRILSAVIKLPADRIRQHIAFEEYGIDSVMVMKMTASLEKVFGNLSRTLFFEYRNIQELTQYFLAAHYSVLAGLLGVANTPQTNAAAPVPLKRISFAELLRSKRSSKGRKYTSAPVNDHAGANGKAPEQMDIAVVGIAGRYPQARNLEEFWENLCQGKDCITEVPKERWDHTLYFDEDRNKAGKTYSKWGGFLTGVDEFDPLFFNISPREAELLDPQERLFLQCAYETIEDAGYSRQTLSDENGLPGNVGVYVGVMYEEYQLYGATSKDNNIALFGNPSSIANRVSYFYNFTGPSMAVDTMCSSSLTAIHLACQGIYNGDCKAAIAGGVNVSVHPNKYVLLAQGKFISGKGHCESFGLGGDGYVPGEGVGAVLLKPLDRAIADGDHIYGIIKATSINHGGKTNGYTVPNPDAQASVISKAFERSGIDPRTISYLEAHGTGTSLGDPIEITGLKKAYEVYTKDSGFCAIGSVKSNIGHGESAAGISGLTKILLQLKHRLLVPSLHSQQLNPNIDFANSPFVVQQELSAWKRPVIGHNGEAREYVRRAGLSSFGAGGSNAHLIIEEFDETIWEEPDAYDTGGVTREPQLILLSAKNAGRLKELVARILTTMKSGRFTDGQLRDIAFTLQTGRDHLETRLALIVASIEELCQKLELWHEGASEINGLFFGKVEKDNETIDAFTTDDDLQQVIGKWMERKKYKKLGAFWVKGLTINWPDLYKQLAPGGRSPKRVSLPGYPFARERYWVPQAVNTVSGVEEKPVQVQHSEEPFQLLTFQEEWTEQPVEEVTAIHSTQQPVRTIACFLSAPGSRKQVEAALQEIAADTKVLFISSSEANNVGDRYCVTGNNAVAWAQVWQSLITDHGNIDALLYLWPLEEQQRVYDQSAIVFLLQAIAASNQKTGKLLLAGQWNRNDVTAGLNRCYLESWIGFVRSVGLTLPGIRLSVLYQEAEQTAVDLFNWTKLLWKELQVAGSHEAFYKNGKRHVYQVYKTALSTSSGLLKQGGTYLITGGLGGLGLLFAKHLAEKYHANLVLTGRSPIDNRKQQAIDALKQYGRKVIYWQADVCDAGRLKEGIKTIGKELGIINGLIHAAGIEEEGTILDRSIDRFEAVLSSKIKGTVLLDELLKDEPLDLVCYFSSSAAILGDFGSCDYAVANRFQMAHAQYRSQLQMQGLRSGKTIAINWPLWKEGGMNLKQQDSTQLYLRSSGQRYLEKQEGITLFERLLVHDAYSHQLVLAGKESALSRFLKLTDGRLPQQPVQAVALDIRPQLMQPDASIEERLESDIMQKVSELLKIAYDRLDVQENLADMGFDSVTLTKLADELGKYFRLEVVPALFFSYATIEKLTAYFIKEHLQHLTNLYNSVNEEKIQVKAPDPVVTPAPAVSNNNSSPALQSDEPIAIVGMSGRFPEARNIEEMWKILADGKNVVTEIPADRFDWQLHYGGEDPVEGKTNCKWTGFLPGISEFDPLFFEIAPAEARLMDPRQRLLLQEGWKALEDAGYGKTHLEKNKIAFYVGVEEGDYGKIARSHGTITSDHNAILAARLSYFLNLSGPNMAINTACSSGLVAAHQAFMSLQNRECDTAIVAGVNLMITPDPYIAMSQAGMLSSDGACHTFDKKANGMVPGEAVAVIVCKRLSQAIADGDPVYATIVASGINYDGKTNGITAPGGLGQTALLKTVYDRYHIDPENIEHIVTHGTGTRLGDPVEVNALYDSFKGYTDKQGYCALTSVKTNFGHTFAASGLVSLISMVQAFRHEAIPASLHCQNDSEYIVWNKSPFYINKSLKPWPAVPGKVRTGAVSAFGMSGTNAHMVLQSYEPAANVSNNNEAAYYLLPLSAKTGEALDEKIHEMIGALTGTGLQQATMTEISYTLMAGRHHFKFRCTIIARDRAEALALLKRAAGREEHPHCTRGEATKGLKAVGEIKDHLPDLVIAFNTFRHDAEKLPGILIKLADYYCQGYTIPWENLFPVQTPARCHLPTYPFSKKKYWITDEQFAHHNNITETDRSVSGQLPGEPAAAVKEMDSVFSGQWLFTKEELVAAEHPGEVNWRPRLNGFTGKTICIIYTTEREKEGMFELLQRMEKAVGLSTPLTINYLPVQQISVDVMKAMRPDVVLILGPGHTRNVASQPAEAEISPLFLLSRSLMHAAWDEPVRIYYLYNSSPQEPRLDCEALSGFFLSAMKENNVHLWRSIRLYEAGDPLVRYQLLLREWLMDESNNRDYTEVHYKENRRWIKQLVEFELPVADKPAFRFGGNYLVTGGTGYLGSLLLKKLAQHYKANLFVLSRSAYNESIKKQCDELQRLGGTVHYFSVDVTRYEDLQKVYRQIRGLAAEVHGVINLARAHDSRIIAAKPLETFHKVSSAKIKSAQYLDELTKDEPLDFFMLFASFGAYGASGESDYAYSCAFQNAFANYRNSLVKEGKRSGVSVAQCWGPWDDDKLFPGHGEKLKQFGCDLITMEAAFPVISSSCMYNGGSLGIIAVADAEKVRRSFGIHHPMTALPSQENNEWEKIIQQWEAEKQKGRSPDFTEVQKTISVEAMQRMDDELVERMYKLFMEAPVADIIRTAVMDILQIETLDNTEPFQAYGLDSIKAMKLAVRLEKKLHTDIRPQWLIEYSTVNELSQHLNSRKEAVLT